MSWYHAEAIGVRLQQLVASLTGSMWAKNDERVDSLEAARDLPPAYDPPTADQVARIVSNKTVRAPQENLPLPFVILGCARSGTTSLCNILDQAINGVCALEPEPNLNFETREAMEGRYPWEREVIRQTVLARAQAVGRKGLIYGEKNVTLGPFIGELASSGGFRFVLITRDGRDVVRSLLNWHTQVFGNIYRECAEPAELHPRAKQASELSAPGDLSDYARPRPGQEDPYFERWPSLSRLEMCAWYWSHINDLFLRELALLASDRWTTIDYSETSSFDVLRIARFLGLDGLDAKTVQPLIDQRINSVMDRTSEQTAFPAWPDWSDEERVRFECIAAPMMIRLGYYPSEGFVRFCPACYGDWWRAHTGGIEWYEWMYNSRRSAHDDLLRFVAEREAEGETLDSILDVGCGRAVGYSDYFEDRHYVGLDLSGANIEWCIANRDNPLHEYRAGDIVTEPINEWFDLVFSQGTIDNCYDINAYLKTMVAASSNWIYVTAYRGWFPVLKDHRYMWDASTTCFYNDLSPAEVRRVLQDLGCTDIRLEALRMENSATKFETRIIARAPAAHRDRLVVRADADPRLETGA